MYHVAAGSLGCRFGSLLQSRRKTSCEGKCSEAACQKLRHASCYLKRPRFMFRCLGKLRS